MELKNDFFYILIKNDRSNDSPNYDFFHLEKIIGKTEVIKILEEIDIKIFFEEKNNFEYFDKITDLLIVTDDLSLLFKYKRAINLYEFKMLCDQIYDEKLITINKRFYKSFERKTDLLSYFDKIFVGLAFSCTMKYHSEEGSNYEHFRVFDKWVINEEVRYLKTPYQYQTEHNIDEIFRFKFFEITKISEVEDYLGVNFFQLPWTVRGDQKVKYYDKKKLIRLISTDKVINEIKILKEEDPYAEIFVKIETFIDHNLYIEYHINSVVINEKMNIHIEDEEDEEDDIFNDDISHNEYLRESYNALTNGESGDFDRWQQNDGDFDKLMNDAGY